MEVKLGVEVIVCTLTEGREIRINPRTERLLVVELRRRRRERASTDTMVW